MPDAPRYFLGNGERLTNRVAAPAGGSSSELPYALDEAVTRLAPRAQSTATSLSALPNAACPQDQAVAVVTLHPQFLAKSYFPTQLLAAYGLRSVGSRPAVVTPERWTRKAEVVPSPATSLFVAGARTSWEALAEDLAETGRHPEDLRKVEDIRSFAPGERVRDARGRSGSADASANGTTGATTTHGHTGAGDLVALEVALHASDTEDSAYIVEAFGDYAAALDVEARLARRLYAGGLCYVPVLAARERVEELALFSFLRVARPVSRLRGVAGSIERTAPSPELAAAPLPAEGPLDPDLRVAVFDGGLPDSGELSSWAVGHETDGVAEPVDGYLEHGHAVTSSVLFGSLTPGVTAARPYCTVDHFRVLDVETSQDPFELFDVLGRIQQVLTDRRYEFFNLSLGPAVPVEDDEVHLWTAVLDEYLADGRSMATIAVGNDGASSEPRIQVPSDCVNSVAVGAADSTRIGWRRAGYSSVGPGRSPGVVKPDVVDFGGSSTEPFLVYAQGAAPTLARTMGTSFASPGLLRRGVGLRAHFGSRLSPLAIQALLVHAADPAGLPREEVGWGRTPAEVSDIAVCGDGMVRVIYQGELTPSQYLRALVPMPPQALAGMVRLTATFSYATPVDAEDPGSYTRSGLDVTFRPHAGKFAKEDAVDPAPKPFFKRSDFDHEHDLRTDAQKWETVLHHGQRFRGSSLHRPTFDIHYNARRGGAPARRAERIRYALVVDLESAKTPDLYDRVSAAYAGQLEALAPVIDVPVRV